MWCRRGSVLFIWVYRVYKWYRCPNVECLTASWNRERPWCSAACQYRAALKYYKVSSSLKRWMPAKTERYSKGRKTHGKGQLNLTRKAVPQFKYCQKGRLPSPYQTCICCLLDHNIWAGSFGSDIWIWSFRILEWNNYIWVWEIHGFSRMFLSFLSLERLHWPSSCDQWRCFTSSLPGHVSW